MKLVTKALLVAAATAGLVVYSAEPAPGTEESKKQVKLVPVPPTETHMVSGRQLYHEYCAACHGHSGKGDGLVAGALK